MAKKIQIRSIFNSTNTWAEAQQKCLAVGANKETRQNVLDWFKTLTQDQPANLTYEGIVNSIIGLATSQKFDKTCGKAEVEEYQKKLEKLMGITPTSSIDLSLFEVGND